MAFGLFVLRIVVGALFVGHGMQKLAGWFGGPGIEGTRGMYRSLGYPQPRTMAWVAGAAEAGAGALLVLGWFTPLTAAAIIGVMINAIGAVHANNGPWASDGGWEYNLVLIAAAVTFAFSGPGLLALDNGLGWDLSGPLYGLGAVLLGVVAGGGVLAVRRDAPAVAESPSREEEQPQAA